MIFSHQYKYLFISMPKTGTHTMYHILRGFYSGQRYGHWHENVPPDFTTDYFKFATVRNPYSRFASAWYYVSHNDRQYKSIYEKLMGHEMDLIYFLNWLNEEKENLYNIRDPQGRLYQLSTILLPQYLNVEQRLSDVKIDKFIKMENLLEEINNLPFVNANRRLSSIPKLHTGTKDPNYKTWNDIKTPEVLELVNKLVDKDFDMFSYEKET